VSNMVSKYLLRSAKLFIAALVRLSSGYRPVIVRSGRRQQGGRLWCGGVAVHVEATAATARDGAVYGAAMTAPTATAVAAVAAVAVAAVAAGRRRGGRWRSG
jgi:hypothetical protein